MAKKKIGRPNEEREANELLDKLKKQKAKKKSPREDSSQTAVRIVKEPTETH